MHSPLALYSIGFVVTDDPDGRALAPWSAEDSPDGTSVALRCTSGEIAVHCDLGAWWTSAVAVRVLRSGTEEPVPAGLEQVARRLGKALAGAGSAAHAQRAWLSRRA
jgi:hypothetical protein